jgi:hypothetical protein
MSDTRGRIATRARIVRRTMTDTPQVDFSGNQMIDWIDALSICSTVLLLTVLASHFGFDKTTLKIVAVSTALAVPIARRRWFGKPTRRADRIASPLGTLSAALVMFGALVAGFAMLMIFLDASRPEPTTTEEAEIEAAIHTPRNERVLQIAEIAAVGIGMIAAGGLLDSRLERSRAA